MALNRQIYISLFKKSQYHRGVKTSTIIGGVWGPSNVAHEGQQSPLEEVKFKLCTGG